MLDGWSHFLGFGLQFGKCRIEGTWKHQKPELRSSLQMTCPGIQQHLSPFDFGLHMSIYMVFKVMRKGTFQSMTEMHTRQRWESPSNSKSQRNTTFSLKLSFLCSPVTLDNPDENWMCNKGSWVQGHTLQLEDHHWPICDLVLVQGKDAWRIQLQQL